jgi:type IV pili sensor histidine kinase/response regulator
MPNRLLLLLAAIATLHNLAEAGTVRSGADGLQLGRYTSIEPTPAPLVSNPLAVVATVSFPRGYVETVGDALRHLLVRTGYRLVDEAQLDEAARALLRLPLPESHRRLGPYRVDAMLQALLGDVWRLQIDPVTRNVRFAAVGSGSADSINTAAASPRP